MSLNTTSIANLAHALLDSIPERIRPQIESKLEKIWNFIMNFPTSLSNFFSWSNRNVASGSTPLTSATDKKIKQTTRSSLKGDQTKRGHALKKEYETIVNSTEPGNISRKTLIQLHDKATKLYNLFQDNELQEVVQSLDIMLSSDFLIANSDFKFARVPGDGNCLFEAIARGLNEKNIGSYTSASLRKLATDKLIQLLDALDANPSSEDSQLILSSIDQSIQDYLEAKNNSLIQEKEGLQTIINWGMEYSTEEELSTARSRLEEIETEFLKEETIDRRDYVTMAKESGFYCGQAEIMMIGNEIPAVAIAVHTRAGGEPVICGGIGEEYTTIHILHDGINHYDRLVESPRKQRQVRLCNIL